jgi:hypothetical protein
LHAGEVQVSRRDLLQQEAPDLSRGAALALHPPGDGQALRRRRQNPRPAAKRAGGPLRSGQGSPPASSWSRSVR